jgi:hypothetical protein
MAPEALAGRVVAGMLASSCVLVGCSRGGADVTVNWTLEPSRPSAGTEIVVQLRVLNADGTPVNGAIIRCEAQMSHPGMAPVTGSLVERGQGVYETRIQLPMAGDWVLSASIDPPAGERVVSSIRVPDVQPAKAPGPVP